MITYEPCYSQRYPQCVITAAAALYSAIAKYNMHSMLSCLTRSYTLG